MEEGSYDIVVKALSETGDTDGFMQTIQVVSTYHEIEKAAYYDPRPACGYLPVQAE